MKPKPSQLPGNHGNVYKQYLPPRCIICVIFSLYVSSLESLNFYDIYCDIRWEVYEGTRNQYMTE